MFYCSKCSPVMGFPDTLGKSRGTCECCGKRNQRCNDMPSSQLPLSKKRRTVTSIKALKRFSTYTEDGDVITEARLMPDSTRVFVLPADAKSYDKMVGQAARKIAYDSSTVGCAADRLTVKAVFAAIGIKCS